ncbi:hypothetical protein [Streptomyces griseorubiginosus]|uniref:hypothetical protein n=1 Tax=Streptomyces griseorubiginosus TaxID=67304 RepID=UPI003D9E7D66
MRFQAGKFIWRPRASAGIAGREVRYEADLQPLRRTARWMDTLTAQWEHRLTAIKDLAVGHGALNTRSAASKACRSAESSPTDQCASQGEEGFVDVVAYLPGNPQAAEPVQMGERALHDPANSSTRQAR